MKRSLILSIITIAFAGCQTSQKPVPKAPEQKMVIDAVPGKTESWQVEMIAAGMSALNREELMSHEVIVGLDSRGSLESQCKGLMEAFGEKTYFGRPLSKTFMLWGSDDNYVLKVVDCALTDQYFDLKNYKVIYIGSESSFEGIINKLRPTGITVVTRPYEGERKLDPLAFKHH